MGNLINFSCRQLESVDKPDVIRLFHESVGDKTFNIELRSFMNRDKTKPPLIGGLTLFEAKTVLRLLTKAIDSAELGEEIRLGKEEIK